MNQLENPTDTEADAPPLSPPSCTIAGTSWIVQHHLLHNRVHLLTRDNSDSVDLWNIAAAKKIASFGKINFDAKVSELNAQTGVLPAWCSVEIKTGGIVVVVDESDALACWTYASELPDVPESDHEEKINLGGLVIQSLFREAQLQHFVADFHKVRCY